MQLHKVSEKISKRNMLNYANFWNCFVWIACLHICVCMCVLSFMIDYIMDENISYKNIYVFQNGHITFFLIESFFIPCHSGLFPAAKPTFQMRIRVWNVAAFFQPCSLVMLLEKQWRMASLQETRILELAPDLACSHARHSGNVSDLSHGRLMKIDHLLSSFIVTLTFK